MGAINTGIKGEGELKKEKTGGQSVGRIGD